MSWHFSREQGAESLPGTCSGGGASAQSSSTLSPGPCCSPDRTTGSYPHSPCGTTSQPSTQIRGAASLTWCRVGFPVPTFLLLDEAQESTASTPDSGRTWPGSFATFDRSSCSWKTHQPSLLGDSDEFSETWPRSGTMRSGACWERATLAPTTDGIASGSLPTPLATDGANGGPNQRGSKGDLRLSSAVQLPTPTVDGNYNRKGASAKSGDGLHTALMLATPTARDWKTGKASQETMDRNSRPLSEQIGGLLNPEFVEKMMGWPRNWTRISGATGDSGTSPPPSASSPTAPTDSNASATVKSRNARPKRGGNLSLAGDGE